MKTNGGSMKDKYYSGHVDYEDIQKLNEEELDTLAEKLSENNKKLKHLLAVKVMIKRIWLILD